MILLDPKGRMYETCDLGENQALPLPVYLFLGHYCKVLKQIPGLFEKLQEEGCLQPFSSVRSECFMLLDSSYYWSQPGSGYEGE